MDISLTGAATSFYSGLRGVYGTDLGNVMQQWAQMGVFAYLLPFLIIFAVIYGVLQATKIFGDEKAKGINMIIAFAIGLLSLQFDFVPSFFQEIFPRAGVGIAVLLIALVLAGLFADWTQRWVLNSFFLVGTVIAAVVILSSLKSYTWWGSGWWQQYGSVILLLIILGAGVAVIVSSKKENEKDKIVSIPVKGLRAD
ncbi:hypothetical protein COV15_02705 [Candidatus Woesearchaeota archaeon CG10_big_fil_rev_8_21_14_0_10_34_12]|nr:MAG: hypothetical protein COV15_02705 [Candidatus Woesearchaeota archaeon CG10_big_fil_rev_8_21_14_0_10_34_12]